MNVSRASDSRAGFKAWAGNWWPKARYRHTSGDHNSAHKRGLRTLPSCDRVGLSLSLSDGTGLLGDVFGRRRAICR